MVRKKAREPFVKLSFAGPRFANARLPADASVNISIYQKILIELAKQIWREKNPNRLRLPRNFDRYFQLQLGELTEGSAVAHLPRFEEDLPPLFGDFAVADIFNLAQDRLVKIVDAANDNEEIPALSRSVRSELRAIRKNLRLNEELMITRGNLSREFDRHKISATTKENITRRISEVRSVSISGFGILSGVSESPAELTVVSEHGTLKFEVSFETARLQYSGQSGKLVDFNVRAVVDYDGLVTSLEAVNAVNLVADTPAMLRAVQRVDELGNVKTGWFNGEGAEISRLTMLTARDVARFISSFEEGAGVFPTVEGEISIEYSRNDLEWTVLVRNQHIVVDVFDLDLNESLVRRFKGTSRGLIQMLLSRNGVLDE